MDNKKEYILCAAIKRVKPRPSGSYKEGSNDIDNIEIGYRHHDIYKRCYDELSMDPEDCGFYTSKGRFLSRKDAMKVAYEAGQVTKEVAFNGPWDCLNIQQPESYVVGDYAELISEELY